MGTPFKMRNGMLLLSTEAPGGIYNSTQLKKIAALCDGDSALVKATEDQRLALFVVPARAQAVAAELKAVGLGVRDYQSGLHQAVNCLGELCSEHLQDALGAAMDLSEELSKVSLGTSLKIGINGCPRSCVPTHTLDISIVGDTGGYRISLGGKNTQLPEIASFMAEGVPAAKLPKLVAKIVSVFKEIAQKDETLQEVMERAGSRRFIDALAPYSQDAHQAEESFGGEPSEAEIAIDLEGGIDLDVTPELGTESFEMETVDIDPVGLEVDGDGLDVPIHSNDDSLALDDASFGPASEASDFSGDTELALDDVGELSGTNGDLEGDLEAEVVTSSGEDELTLDDIGELETAELATDAGTATDGGSVEDDLALGDIGVLVPIEADEPLDQLELDELEVGESSLDGASDLPLDGETLTAPALAELTFEEELMPGDSVPLTGLPETDAGETILADEMMTFEDDEPETQSLGDMPLDGVESDDIAFEEVALDETPETMVATPTAAASAPSAPASFVADEDDEMTAEEVDEDDADAFEEKLNASIDEEEALPEAEDLNSHARLEAMRLIEAGVEDRSIPADFQDLQIDHLEDEAEEATNDSGAAHELEDTFEVEGLDTPAFEPELIPSEPLPVMAPRAVAAPASLAKAAARSAKSSSGFSFTGFDLAAGGRVTLSFSSGARITVDPATFASSAREMTIGGTRVRIAPQDGGLSVEVDGVAIFVPQMAA